MTYSRRLAGASAVLLACVFVGGVPAKPAAKAPPLDIGLSASPGQIFQPDPNLPGKYLWKMYIQGGSVMPQSSGYTGSLIGVTALLYQHGAPSARLTAPVASGNSIQEVIVATGPGRVRAQSLVDPGRALEADKMTYYAKKNRIVAIGNVVVFQSGRNGPTMRVPRAPVTADTVLKSVTFGKGTGTLP